jgi:C1A family cysteine protease
LAVITGLTANLTGATVAVAEPSEPSEPSETVEVVEAAEWADENELGLTGYISPDIDYQIINETDYSQAFDHNVRLPTSLDLRYTIGAVRNQGSNGDCWAFAATASASSGLAAGGQAGPELSTLHLDNAVYNELGIHSYSGRAADFTRDGGNALLTVGAWSKWYGAQTAADYPRDSGSTRYTLSQINSSAYRLEGMYIFPGPRDGNRVYLPENVAATKQAMLQYGVLYVGYYADGGQTGNRASDAYNPATAAYYYPDIKGSAWNGAYRANHAVALVGYDDSYPASNFSTTPPGDGAWLAQNSWGDGWGDGGYFWLSYYDYTTEPSYYFDLEAPRSNIDYNFFHDDGPSTKSVSYGGRQITGANVFTVPEGGAKVIRAVSFYAGQPNRDYEIAIYKNPPTGKPTGGTRLDIAVGEGETVKGHIDFSGFHQVDVAGVRLEPGETFAVVITITATVPGSATLSMEGSMGQHVAYVDVAPGQSYSSNNGGTSWTDLYSKGGNLSIKAMAGPPQVFEFNLQELFKVLLNLIKNLISQMLSSLWAISPVTTTTLP